MIFRPKMRIRNFSTTFLYTIFHCKKDSTWHYHNCATSSYEVPDIIVGFKSSLNFLGRFSKKNSSNSKLYGNPSSGSRVVPKRQQEEKHGEAILKYANVPNEIKSRVTVNIGRGGCCLGTSLEVCASSQSTLRRTCCTEESKWLRRTLRFCCLALLHVLGVSRFQILSQKQANVTVMFFQSSQANSRRAVVWNSDTEASFHIYTRS